MVLFETCTAAGWVYDICYELGLPRKVVNPLGEAWQWSKVKRKTDRDDAFKLIRLYLLNELPTVYVPPLETREHRALVGFRQRLIERRTVTQNHIRALFQAQGVNWPSGHLAWGVKARIEILDGNAKPLKDCAAGELWRGELHMELELYDKLVVEINRLTHKLDAMGKANPGVRLLMTIPGVGARTAEAVVAYLGDPHRFRTAGQVLAYAGLVPRLYQSGNMERKGRITKRGPCYLRKILVECAWLAIRYNDWAAALVERISRGQKKRRKSAVVALARKLLVRCWAMLRTGQPWKEPEPAPVPIAA
jgi:transposase